MPADPEPVVVLAAHGSRADAANDAHRDLARDLAATLGLVVLPVFLELAPPTIADAIDAAVTLDAQTVVVLPYFLHPGRHLSDDVPRIVDAARTRHPHVVIDLLGAFGADRAVVDLLANQVRDALPGR